MSRPSNRAVRSRIRQYRQRMILESCTEWVIANHPEVYAEMVSKALSIYPYLPDAHSRPLDAIVRHIKV